MKKLISGLMSVVMAGTIINFSVTAAERCTFQVNGFGIESGTATTEVFTVDTGIPGIKASVGADKNWTIKSAKHESPNGNTYTYSIAGSDNPDYAAGKGTFYSFELADTVPNGKIEIACEIGANKKFNILKDGTAIEGYNEKIFSVTEKTAFYEEIDVEGGHTYTVYVSGSKMNLYGITYREVNPQQDFAEEIAAFPFEEIKGANADMANVEENLEPIQSYESKFGSCDVRWESSNEAVIAKDGTVNPQKTDTTVTFTGYFSVQENDSLAASKSFEITVLGDPDDASAVAVAKESLTLGDTSSVKKNIALPVSGRKGTTVTWTTSDADIVTADGVVTRAPGEDRTAVLTAVITRGDASAAKAFEITVAGYTPVVFNSYAYADANGNTVYSPVDGGSLKAINITCSIPETTDNDIINVKIFDENNTEKASKDIQLSEADTEHDSNITVDMPMDSTDYFVINIGSGTTSYLSDIKADDAVKDGAVIYVVGDSTAAVYDDKNYPRKGWAQLLGNYFDDVEVVDYALSGRSSLNFKNETNYRNLQSNIKAGDYLIIQFGHNDSKNEIERYTNPVGDRFTDGTFQKSMFEYIELARDKGAHPILATSISRRQLSDASLEAYVNAARELGEETLVPVLDLYKSTNGWINWVGKEAAKSMFNYVNPQDTRFADYPGFAASGFYENGTTDDTHININGADLISQWATEYLKELAHPLASKLNDYQAVYPLPAYDENYPCPAATPKPETPTVKPAEPTPKPTEGNILSVEQLDGIGSYLNSGLTITETMMLNESGQKEIHLSLHTLNSPKAEEFNFMIVSYNDEGVVTGVGIDTQTLTEDGIEFKAIVPEGKCKAMLWDSSQTPVTSQLLK